MIGPGTGVRVYLACGVTDMRKGIAGLSTIAQDVLRQKPALQGARAGALSVALGEGWRRAADLGTACDALGRDRLAAA
jgi:hypothetical protein